MTRLALSQLRHTDDQQALLKQALHEAQQAVEAALICARELDPDAETTLHLHQTVQDIDHALVDIAAEAFMLSRTIREQYDLIDQLYRQRDEAYDQRDAILRVARSRQKRRD